LTFALIHYKKKAI